MFRWDGGFIMLSPDNFDEGVKWYTETLGWECVDQVVSWVGRKAFMKLPRFGMVTLKSFESDYDHFAPTDIEGNVKLCFASYNIEKTIQYLAEQNIETTKIITLPNGQRMCDITAFNNTKLTVVEESAGDSKEEKEYPPAGIIGFGSMNTIIEVTDPQLSAEWYKNNLGFEIVEINDEKGYAHMRTEDAYDRMVLDQCFWDNIWLLKGESMKDKPNDSKARTYYDIRPDVFFDEYNKLIKNGIKPSEIAGNPIKGWGGFHIYDPDNNRINVWSYMMN